VAVKSHRQASSPSRVTAYATYAVGSASCSFAYHLPSLIWPLQADPFHFAPSRRLATRVSMYIESLTTSLELTNRSERYVPGRMTSYHQATHAIASTATDIPSRSQVRLTLSVRGISLTLPPLAADKCPFLRSLVTESSAQRLDGLTEMIVQDRHDPHGSPWRPCRALLRSSGRLTCCCRRGRRLRMRSAPHRCWYRTRYTL